ncbi:UNVERIFIED_CONTAM: hypothetical protein Slati_3017800 [Sesamum latifolium]|uniref:Reverse transcriptase RNase H-like domain-containing protein n=1 Tax=Sesamum latifolium TaxID=2727402 RepID=A0AAW2VJL6_9LAMI
MRYQEKNLKKKSGKDPVLTEETEVKEKTLIKVQPAEELLPIELILGNLEKISQIGFQMENTILQETLRKAKNFELDISCQHAFEELKEYLARLPLLVKPSPGDTPYLYLSVTLGGGGRQMPIYYVSQVLTGAKGRYIPTEKIALALVVTARRLRPYFLSYPIGVRTNLPLKQTLGKPDTSWRLVKWAKELSEYDISYLRQAAIKAQALAKFVSEMTKPP